MIDKKIRTERVTFKGGGASYSGGSPSPSPSPGPSNAPGSDPSPSPSPSPGPSNAPGSDPSPSPTPARDTYRTTTQYNTPTPVPTPTGPTTRPNPNNIPGTSPVSFPTPTPIPTGPTTNFNIHGVGPSYQVPIQKPTFPSTNYSLGQVAGVDYSLINNPNSQFNKNTALNKKLLETPYKGINTPFMGLNVLGNALGKFGYNVNTKFFSDNSIGGKINPETGQPFGYGIDGYKDYMRQRQLGNVGAYGGTELSQNAINERSGGDDGIMDVYNAPNYTDDGDAGDADGDGDSDQDDFIFRYFDKTGETLQAGAGGVQDLMTRIRQRISDIFS